MIDEPETQTTDNVTELNFLKFALDEHAIVSIADIKGNITYVNDKFRDISGYDRNELIGKNHRILKSDEHSTAFYTDLWKTISNGETWNGEIRNLRKNGESYWVKATIVPFLNEDGKPFQYVGIRTDITQQKILEESLRESETKHRLLFASTTQGVVYQKVDGSITSANPAAESILGLSLDQMQGKTSSDPRWRAVDADGEDFTGESHPAMVALGTGESVIGVLMGVFIPEQKKYRWISVDAIPQFREGEDKPYEVYTTFSDITKQREAEVALLEAMNNAEKANQAKSEFLSSMSHELRTPMNAILGFAQMLEFNPKEPLTETQKSSVDHIMKGGNHLLSLINDVLDLAKIEAGKVEFSIEEIDANKITDECLSLTIGMATDRGIEISVLDNTTVRPMVRADYTRFKQVLVNLISNAVKYNNENGKISITYEQIDENALRIAIADTGLGIPKYRQGELFQPFNRLDAENSEIEGTGIGLVVCKNLVELMDGTIGFESEEGKGSTFWFELPLAVSPNAIEDTQKAVEAAGVTGKLEEINGIMLYVEDNPSNLQLMEMIVSRIDGLTMLSTHTAELGIEIARSNQPDVIILDINLPGMSGLDAIAELKTHGKTKNIPVLALSAAATKSDIEKGTEAGFLHYLTKPMNVAEVTDAIREALENRDVKLPSR